MQRVQTPASLCWPLLLQSGVTVVAPVASAGVTGKQVREVSWFRRPRRRVPGPFAQPMRSFLVTFSLGVAFLLGLSFLVSEDEWWVKACGGLASLGSVVTSATLMAYLLRPVRDEEDLEDPLDGPQIASWAKGLERHGHVEVALSGRKVTVTFAGIGVMLAVAIGLMHFLGGPYGVSLGVVTSVMFVFLALIPHLEFVTAGRPVVRVDPRGLEIARWTPLTIPWTDVLEVRAHRSTEKQTNVVVHVTDNFYEEYLASRPFPLRLADALSSYFTGRGFSIPSTTAASPETLAAWLDSETQRRVGHRPT
jgi:hypothetical protein